MLYAHIHMHTGTHTHNVNREELNITEMTLSVTYACYRPHINSKVCFYTVCYIALI